MRILALSCIRRARRARRSFNRTGDAERLHDLRVAVRKLRNLLRAYRSVLDDSVRRKDRRRLRAATVATNALRELDVRTAHLDGLAAFASDTHAAERLREHAATARAAAVDNVRDWLDDELRGVLRRLRKRMRRVTLDLEQNKQITAGTPFAVVLADTLTRLRHQLEDQLGRAAQAEDDSRIHVARIAAKRLRYALEPVARSGPAATAMARLTELQDLMGQYQDMGDALAAMDRELALAHRTGDDALVSSLDELLGRARTQRTDALERIRADWLYDAGATRLTPLERVIARLIAAARDWPVDVTKT